MSSNPAPQLSGSAQSNNNNTTSHITQSFRDQKKIESFIRSTKLQKIIERAVEQYLSVFKQSKLSEDAFAAIIVNVSIVYSDLLYPGGVDLLQLIVEEPLQFAEAFKYCVFNLVRECVKSYPDVGLKTIDIAQVHDQLRFSGLPLQECMFFEPAQNRFPTSLSVVVGVLSAFTEPEKHILQSVWFCSTGCSRNKIKLESIEAPLCSNCSTEMCEYSKLRATANYRLLRLLPVSCVQTPRVLNKIFRAVTVRVREHVYDCELLLGTRMATNQALNDALHVVRDLTNNDLDDLLRIEFSPRTLSTITAETESQALNGAGDADRSQNMIMSPSIMRFNREELSSQMNVSQWSSAAASRSLKLSSSVSNSNDFNFNVSLQQIPQQMSQRKEQSSSLIFESPEIDMISLNETEETRSDKNAVDDNDIINDTMQFSDVASINNKTLNLSSIQGSPKATNMNCSFEQEFAKFQNIDLDELNFDFEQINQLEQTYIMKEKDSSHERLHKTQGDVEKSLNELPKTTEKLASTYPNVALAREKSKNQEKCVVQPAGVTSFEPLDYSRTHDAQPNKAQQQEAKKLTVMEAQNVPHVPSGGSFRACGSIYSGLAPNISSVADATLVPPGVKQLYDIIKEQYTDFAFVYALSAQLCQDRVPMDCFVNLKLGLLLSLASIGTNPDRPPIPLIAIGNDAQICNYLLTNVGQLAARFVGPTDDVRPPPSPVIGNINYTWIEADPILLAKGGVFYVGDWSRLKAARSDKLFKDIECSRIAIEQPKYVYPLETAIWAHWRASKSTAMDQQIFNKFIKVFGIPIVADDNNHEVLVNYILEQSSERLFESTIDHLSISTEEMRAFLAVISKRTVDLSTEASDILQKYFVASRIERPDCLSKQAFSVLKQFSESFAKLSFRYEVLAIDAYAAVFMCENYIQNIFGPNEEPPPAFESQNYIGNVDGHIIKFKKWLSKYIERYNNKP